jgi:hypothetical protein
MKSIKPHPEKVLKDALERLKYGATTLVWNDSIDKLMKKLDKNIIVDILNTNNSSYTVELLTPEQKIVKNNKIFELQDPNHRGPYVLQYS